MINKKVRIFRYVTKGTFDAYNWGLVENKQKIHRPDHDREIPGALY